MANAAGTAEMMHWKQERPGRYVTPEGYVIERETYSNSFSETRSTWRVIFDGHAVAAESTLTAAKRAGDRHAAKKASGQCWFPTCDKPATGTTPGLRVSSSVDIDTCDECHHRCTGPAGGVRRPSHVVGDLVTVQQSDGLPKQGKVVRVQPRDDSARYRVVWGEGIMQWGWFYESEVH
jgi:hypothetical protein